MIEKIKKIFRKKKFHIIKLIVVITAIYFIWHSDKIKQQANPQKYLEEKVKKLQKTVTIDKLKIQSLEVDLKKEKQNCIYEKEKTKIDAIVFDKDEDKSIECLNISHKKKLDNISESITAMNQLYLKDLEELENAVSNLEEINKITIKQRESPLL